MPDTLVHGDFHPGNLRGDDTALVLLDWATAESAIHCSMSRPSLIAYRPMASRRSADIGTRSGGMRSQDPTQIAPPSCSGRLLQPARQSCIRRSWTTSSRRSSGTTRPIPPAGSCGLPELIRGVA